MPSGFTAFSRPLWPFAMLRHRRWARPTCSALRRTSTMKKKHGTTLKPAQTNATRYNGPDAANMLRTWAGYSDRRLTGCIVRQRRFADPNDPTAQKSSLGFLLPVRGGGGLLQASYLSASDPNRRRQLPITFPALTVPGMHRDCWPNVTKTVLEADELIERLECLRCHRPLRGPHVGPTCSREHDCVFLAFHPRIMDLVNAVEVHPEFVGESPQKRRSLRGFKRRRLTNAGKASPLRNGYSEIAGGEA